jgi:hypothetical protein
MGYATIPALWIGPDLSKLRLSPLEYQNGAGGSSSERFVEAADNEGGIAHDDR